MPIVFVTGTDTGVGKTTVSSLIIQNLVDRGLKVFVSKPVETGCRVLDSGELFPSDAARLLELSCGMQSMDEVVNYRFTQPLAPQVAAELSKTTISFDRIVSGIKEMERASDIVILEGAGGLLVPLSSGKSYANLAQAVGARVLVVVGSRLGAINHAALTFEVLGVRELPVIGYVLNEFSMSFPESEDAILTNRSSIQQIARSYEIYEQGYFSHLDDVDNIDRIKQYASSAECKRLVDSIMGY